MYDYIVEIKEPTKGSEEMIRLAPVALLALAILVPMCTGTVWGNLLIVLIACGIFFGTVSLGSSKSAEDLQALPDNKT